MGMPENTTEQMYEFLFEDDEGRSCESIPDAACTNVPANAIRNMASGAFSKLAEQLAHPGLTIPWLLSSLGVPAAISALPLPLKDAGSLAPQLFLAQLVRSRPRRNRIWAAVAVVQAAILLVMAGALLLLPAVAGGVATAALFLVFGIASGVASLSFKDTVGKTIPRPRRGTLLGLRASIGGGVALLAGALFGLLGTDGAPVEALLILLVAAAACWLASGFLFFRINEEAGSTSGGTNPFDSVREAIALFREHDNMRRFVAARSLDLSLTLIQPLYVIIIADRLGFSFSGIGTLLVASAGAQLVSGYVWGRLTDRSARRVLVIAPFLGVAVGVLFFLMPVLGGVAAGTVAHGVVLFLHNIAYAGARVGRKTYLVNAASNENRAVFAAGANTAIGAVTLAMSALVSAVTGIAGTVSSAVMLLAMLSGGALLALRLREV